jgi:hypothetical protein
METKRGEPWPQASNEPEWHDGPEWLVEMGAAEAWFDTEWTRWELLRKRFDEAGVELTFERGAPDAVYAVHEGRWLCGEFLNPELRMPLQSALIELVKRVWDILESRSSAA